MSPRARKNSPSEEVLYGEAGNGIAPRIKQIAAMIHIITDTFKAMCMSPSPLVL